jgi:hypothetical protein
MDEEAPTGVHRRGPRRWVRRLLILAIVLPPAAFGLSNLALDSHRARTWISHKIQARTTLETSIDGVSWSPWNGVTVRGLTMLQPEPLRKLVEKPLVRITQIRVRPVWETLVTKEPEIRDISLTEPKIVFPVEILSVLARPAAPSDGVTPAIQEPPTPLPMGDLVSAPPMESPPPHSDVAENTKPDPAEPTVAAPPRTTPPSVSAPVAPPTMASPPSTEVAPKPSAEAPSPQAAAAPSTPTVRENPSAASPRPLPPVPTQFIHLENATFTLVMAGTEKDLLGVSGVTGKVPIAGDPGTSTLNIGSLSSMGNTLLEKRALALDWRAPLITMAPIDEQIGVFITRITSQLAVLPGIPLAFGATVPKQAVESLALPGGAVFKALSASADLQIRGQLLFPSTWKASFVNQSTKPSVTSNGQETKFDEARSLTVLQNGSISCVDARIVGDQLSMLGNATILSTGSTAGVLRIVAPPETTIGIVNRFFPGLQAPPAFSSMSTPQRVALDIEASGSLGDIQIRLGKNGPLAGQPKPPATATPP